MERLMSVSDPSRQLTEFRRSEAAPEAVVPLIAMSIESHWLNAKVVLLERCRQMLIEHIVGLGCAFLSGAVGIGFLHCGSCLCHRKENGLRDADFKRRFRCRVENQRW